MYAMQASHWIVGHVVCRLDLSWCDFGPFSIFVLRDGTWTALPRRLRLLFGEADGAMPCCDILPVRRRPGLGTYAASS